jgi:hypothetical protein
MLDPNHDGTRVVSGNLLVSRRHGLGLVDLRPWLDAILSLSHSGQSCAGVTARPRSVFKGWSWILSENWILIRPFLQMKTTTDLKLAKLHKRKLCFP